MVLGTKDLEGSLLMPERAGHNTMDVKINWAELAAFIGVGPQPMAHGPSKPTLKSNQRSARTVLGKLFETAQRRAVVICLPSGMGRGMKHTPGSGV